MKNNEEKRLIAAFMGYVYYEEDVYSDSDDYRARADYYSKVPIEIIRDDYCDKHFKDLPNPDYGKRNPVKWNNKIKMISWLSIYHDQYVTDLHYDTSWDQLRPVIDKIFEYAVAYRKEVAKVINMKIVVDIKVAYQAVLEFIRFLNNQNQRK